jgi:hypothetical protein
MGTETHKLLISLGYKVAEDSWDTNGRVTYIHGDDADRAHVSKLRQSLQKAGWQTDYSKLWAFQHTQTAEIIEIEPGGSEMSGHFLHRMKRDL